MLDFTEYFDIIRTVESTSTGIVTALAALAQHTRLALFRLLVEAGPGGLAAGAIAERLGVAAPTLSFHLKELTHAGLIRSVQQGRFVIYRADFEAMSALIAYLTENCCGMTCDAECGPSCAPKAEAGGTRARKRALHRIHTAVSSPSQRKRP